MVGAVTLVCLVCSLDLFGVVARVPDLAQVVSVDVSFSPGFPDDSGQSYHKQALADPAQIEKFIALHQAVIRERGRVRGQGYEPANDYTYLLLTYTLQDGSTLHRAYHSIPVFQAEVGVADSVTACATQLLADRALVADSYDFEYFEQGRLVEAYLNNVRSARDEHFTQLFLDGYAPQLWAAVRQDFQEGTIGVRYLFYDDSQHRENTYTAELSFSWEMPSSNEPTIVMENGPLSAAKSTRSSTLTIALTPNARNTLAVLEQSGLLDESYGLTLSSASQ
jgi:ABC-2 type transport system permease protein